MGTIGRFGRLAATAWCGLFLLQAAAPQGAAAVSKAWTKTYNGPSDGSDVGDDVALGADGCIYVAGYTDVAGEGANLLLRKYSPSGVHRWTRTYNGPDNLEDYGFGVALAVDGSVYVAGYTQVGVPNDHQTDLLLQKYSPAGALLWTQTLDLAGFDDIGRAVAVAPDGSVYVAGATRGFNALSLLLQKFSDAGDPLWTRTFDGPGPGGDGASGVATDSDGSVYAVGYTSVADPVVGSDPNFLLRKYSADGDLLWSETHAGSGGSDAGADVAVAPDHSVVTVGGTLLSGHNNIMLRKYTADGALLWARTSMAGATFYGNASGTGVAVGPDGTIAIVGCVAPPEKMEGIYVGGYSADGTALWGATYNGAAGGFDCGWGVAVGSGGGVFATGEVATSAHGPDLWLSKYK